jgi:hypothetical protein
MMPLYAKVVDGVIVAREMKDNPDSITSSDGGPVWRPIVEDRPAYDVRHQRLSGPVEVIEQAQVVRRWIVEALSHAEMANRVAEERRRRLESGFSYDFGDARGVHQIGTTEQDMIGWDEVTSVAQAAINAGAPSMEIAIVTDTGPATVTALEWQSILLAAGAARQPVWAASFVIQALDPIPADYADDARWPNAPGQ